MILLGCFLTNNKYTNSQLQPNIEVYHTFSNTGKTNQVINNKTEVIRYKYYIYNEIDTGLFLFILAFTLYILSGELSIRVFGNWSPALLH